MIGPGVEYRHQHEVLDACVGGRSDQRSGAEAIHGSRGRSCDAAKPADRTHDGPGPVDGALQCLRVRHVARGRFNAVGKLSIHATHERTNCLPALDEPRDETFAERARPTRDENHRQSTFSMAGTSSQTPSPIRSLLSKVCQG